LLLVVGAPFVGLVSLWLRDVAGGNYARALAAIVGTCTVAAIGFAVVTIRERRAERYRWIVAAVVVAVGYALLSRSGVADVDAAERFHFIEYGLIAVLFYKAWQPSADASVVVMPLLTGVLVGTCEEWLQWFVPARVGEWRDVVLNLVAVGCGVMFSLGLDPPATRTTALTARSRRRVAFLAVGVIVAFAAFIQSVHLGHDVVDAEAGVFRSRYTGQELAQLSIERAERWRTNPPLTVSRLSREDQYFTEGIAHVRRRNERWGEGNLLAARHENLILEKYYAPVLDAPSWASPVGMRWPDAQRAQAEATPAAGPGFMIYDSDALSYPVFTWPVWAFWLVVLATAIGVLRALRVTTKV
jgi:VanZ family protein